MSSRSLAATIRTRASRWALTLAAALVLPAAASAHVVSAGLDVEVYDRTEQRVLPIYYKDGQRWIEGTPGHEYSLRVRNNGGARVLAVGSVDGVNIVTGETASPAQSGYVLGPRDYLEMAGWRKDLSRTASFYFTNLGDAYATRTGRPDNVGVIGIAVFRERRVRIMDYPMQLGDSARKSAAAPSSAPQSAAPTAEARAERSADAAMGAAAPAPSLGTGHGRIEDSPATRVNFVRESSTPSEVITIRYDRRENLIAMGIVPSAPIARWADPFPHAKSGFVPDPPR